LSVDNLNGSKVCYNSGFVNYQWVLFPDICSSS
jgi:hypothetical protein